MLGRRSDRGEPIGELPTGESIQDELMRESGLHSPREMEAIQGSVVTLSELKMNRGLESSGPIHGYTPLTPPDSRHHGHNVIQLFPSDRNGQWPLAGSIGQITMPFKSRSASGYQQQSVVAFNSEWGIASLELDAAEKLAAEKGQYHPGVKGLFFIFRYTPDRGHPFALTHKEYRNAGNWVLTDKLEESDVHHANGMVNAIVPRYDRETGKQLGEESVIGDLNSASKKLRDGFRKKYATERNPAAYKDKIDTIIMSLGQHFDTDNLYDYRTDDKLSYEDIDLINNYVEYNAGDPLTLVAPLLAFKEFMKLDIFAARKRKSSEGLTATDKAMLEERRDHIREEVLQAMESKIIDHKFSKTPNPETKKFFHARRWGARLITPDDLDVMRGLVDHPDSPCQQEASQYIEAFGKLDSPVLDIRATPGNKLIVSSSYKSGEQGEVSDKPYQYVSSMSPCIPVEAPFGAFPLEIQSSFSLNDRPNMVAGIVAEFSALGTRMTDIPERYLIVDGRLTHAKITMNALRYFAAMQKVISEKNSEKTLPVAPSMSDLLFAPEDEQKTNITIATINKNKVNFLFKLPPASGVEFIQRSNGATIEPVPTRLVPFRTSLTKDAPNTTRSDEHYRSVPASVQEGDVVLAGIQHRFDNVHMMGARPKGQPATDVRVMSNNASRVYRQIKEFAPKLEDYGSGRGGRSVIPRMGRRGRRRQ